MTEGGEREENDIYLVVVGQDLNAFTHRPGKTNVFTGQLQINLLGRGEVRTGQRVRNYFLDGKQVQVKPSRDRPDRHDPRAPRLWRRW